MDRRFLTIFRRFPDVIDCDPWSYRVQRCLLLGSTAEFLPPFKRHWHRHFHTQTLVRMSIRYWSTLHTVFRSHRPYSPFGSIPGSRYSSSPPVALRRVSSSGLSLGPGRELVSDPLAPDRVGWTVNVRIPLPDRVAAQTCDTYEPAAYGCGPSVSLRLRHPLVLWSWQNPRHRRHGPCADHPRCRR